MCSVLLRSWARPGVVTNCTIDEYRDKLPVGNGVVIHVHEHKTAGTTGTAKLVVSHTLLERLELYFNVIRPKMVSPGRDIV